MQVLLSQVLAKQQHLPSLNPKLEGMAVPMQMSGSTGAGLALVMRQSKPAEMEPTGGVGDPACPTV